MPTRLILIAHAGTRLMREGGFPDSAAPLDDGGRAKLAAYRWTGARPDQVFHAPSQAAVETTAALGFPSVEAAELAEADQAAWRGRTFADVASREPEAFAAWTADPAVGVPGGEGLDVVRARVGAWLDARRESGGLVLGVTTASVIRCALAHALDIPAAATLRIDIAPLASVTLSFNRMWRLQGLA